MPLQVVAALLDNLTGGDYIIREIANFKETGKTQSLYRALSEFASVAYNGSVETMLLEVAIHYSEGAKKYGENNWQKGIPTDCYLDSAIRHYLKYRRHDSDEPHSRAFVWNVLCCCWEVDYHSQSK